MNLQGKEKKKKKKRPGAAESLWYAVNLYCCSIRGAGEAVKACLSGTEPHGEKESSRVGGLLHPRAWLSRLGDGISGGTLWTGRQRPGLSFAQQCDMLQSWVI